MGRFAIALGIAWLLLFAMVAGGWVSLVRRPIVQMPEMMQWVVAGWGVAVALVFAVLGVWLVRLGRWLRRRKKLRAEKRAARKVSVQGSPSGNM